MRLPGKNTFREQFWRRKVLQFFRVDSERYRSRAKKKMLARKRGAARTRSVLEYKDGVPALLFNSVREPRLFSYKFYLIYLSGISRYTQEPVSPGTYQYTCRASLDAKNLSQCAAYSLPELSDLPISLRPDHQGTLSHICP